jgi:nicotinamide-nucleotide amidase
MFDATTPMLKAEIVTIGNELTSGLIVDSNSATLCRRLLESGVAVRRVTVVGDDAEAIRTAVATALQGAELVILAGGLGATHDDITKQTLADMFGSAYRHDAKVREMIEAIYRARGKEAPAYTLSQCEVPERAEILYNEKGTAPGLLFRQGSKRVYSLPGVPLEMEHLLEKYILPPLAEKNSLRIEHRILHTTGVTESGLWERFGPMAELEQLAQVASLPSHLGVRIRLSVWGQEAAANRSRLDAAEALLREKLGDWIFARDDETLEAVVGDLLRRRGLTLAVAESCTGGLIAGRLTHVAGSSDYFIEGAVVYANSAKMRRLGIGEDVLARHGAVSRETALAMAHGMRTTTGADIGLSVTGIAGPGGGGAEKPVGLTFVGLSHAAGEACERFLFHQDRRRNRERAVQAALNLLRLWLARDLR